MTAFTAGVPFKNRAILAVYPNARMALQAAFGADLATDADTWTWTDLTTYVRQNDGNIVSITPMGRSDESSTAQPAGLGAVLDASDGNLVAYHPASQYYPYVRRNTPIRFLVNLTGDDADTSTRFFGLANGWPLSWQDDGTARIPVVTLTASGETRRLKQGTTPLKAAPLRTWKSDAGMVAGWPMSDGDDATTAGSFLSSGSPMTIESGTVDFAATGGLFGLTFPKVTGSTDVTPFSGRLVGDVPSYSASTWQIEASINAVASSDNAIGHVLGWTTTSDAKYPSAYLRLVYDIGGSDTVLVNFLNADGTVGGTIGGATGKRVVDGNWHYIRVLHENLGGGNARFTLYIDDDYSSSSGSVTATIGSVNRIRWPGPEVVTTDPALDESSVAFIGVTTTNVDRSDAATGYLQELATDRLNRLGTEVGVVTTVVGTSTVTMGAQGVDTFLNLQRECEIADGGLLLNGFGQGYLYVTRNARYNQDAALTVSAVAAQLAPPLGAQDNDQRDVNLFVASRKGGSSATHEQRDGPKGTDAIGTYDSSGTYNLYDDTPLLDYASWATHLGTVEGYRYPTLTLDFTAPDVTALAAAWLDVLPSSLVEVTSPADVFANHPPGDVGVLVEGWGEQISPYVWTATLNCSPGAGWQVGTIQGDERLDCKGSTTNEALDSTETGVDVLITDNCVWAHNDGNYPIVIGGEVMTVTAVGAVSGSIPSRTQTLTVVRSVNGIVKTHATGAEVHVLYPITQAL